MPEGYWFHVPESDFLQMERTALELAMLEAFEKRDVRALLRSLG
jgi:hypothetical protein